MTCTGSMHSISVRVEPVPVLRTNYRQREKEVHATMRNWRHPCLSMRPFLVVPALLWGVRNRKRVLNHTIQCNSGKRSGGTGVGLPNSCRYVGNRNIASVILVSLYITHSKPPTWLFTAKLRCCSSADTVCQADDDLAKLADCR
jgi:hypothetical protein